MKKFLIIKPSSLGDIIHAMQVATLIVKQLPDAQIDWIARDIFAPFVENCAIVRKVFIYRRKEQIKALLSLRKELKKERYDYVLDMQGLLRSGLMAMFANAPVKIARADARDFSWIFCNKKVSMPAGNPPYHAVEILMEFLPACGLEKIAPAHLDFKNMQSPVGESGYIALFPGSRGEEKKWPYYFELTKKFLDAGHACAWGGSKGDVPESQIEELENYSKNFKNFIGKTRLDELPAFIGASEFAICNDSGPMHLAAVMQKNVLAIFGPTDPKNFGPYPLNAPTNAAIRAKNGDLKTLQAEEVFELCMEKFLKN